MTFPHRHFAAAILRAPETDSGSGPLSIEAATNLVLGAPAEEAPIPEAEDAGAETQPPQADDTPSEALPDADEAPDPDAPAIEGEQEAEPVSDPELPAIAAPRSWAAEDKDTFATLPREAQAIILAREEARDRAVTKAQQEASDAAKRVEAELSTIGQYKGQLDEVLARAKQAHSRDFGDNPDWPATLAHLTEQHGPEVGVQQYLLLKEQHEGQRAEIQRAEHARKVAADADLQAHKARENPRIAELVPDLADPERGQERTAELGKLLQSAKVTPEQMLWMTAEEVGIAYDALQWRNHLKAEAAKAKTAKAVLTPPKPIQTPPQRPPVRPTAAAAAPPTAQRVAAESKNRFAQRPTVGNAIAALLARQKG